MFLSTILLALIVGALAGGGLPRLADLKLRWLWLLLVALGLRVAGAWGGRELGLGDTALPGILFIAGYAFIFVWLWANASVPGLQIASVGIGANAAALVFNGGQMPIWPGAYLAAGFTPEDIAGDPFHFILTADTVAGFVTSGGILGDVIPIPFPLIRDVVSIGDVILAVGIFWALVYSMTRREAPARAALALGATPQRSMAAGAFSAGVAYAGEAGGAVAIPAEAGADAEERGAPRAQSPYLRLVRNRNFSLLWVGQLVSLLGDRLHVVALGALVTTRGSELEVGLTFAATAVPNVVLGPLAGVLVDRWDRRVTMIVCDLTRALLVLAVPFAFEVDILLVYLCGFLIASVTLLFRPAKTAIIPAVVDERDLVTANSASSVSDTAADLLGFPIAGLIVASLSSVLGAAFVLDAATYVISALLVWAMVVPRQLAVPAERLTVGAAWREIGEGFAFLRSRTQLLANTLLSTMAQVAVGAEIVVSLLYARDVVDRGTVSFEQVYAFLLTAIALGSVVGGLVVGAYGARLPKGLAIIAGFVGMGLSLVGAGLTTSPVLAIAAFFATGFTNMLFIIPTITMFQEQTPQRLMGRVVSSRQTLVFGSIAASMAASGFLAAIIGPSMVFIASGAICALAGLIGLAVPAMRDAR